ncbi:hypothetical protein D3C87_144430 [compost metagenome]
MIDCPICLQSVEKLKSGSHVIPRWAMKLTKEGGNFASLDLKAKDQPKAKREQDDLVCELWCENCENRFRDDDANGARFFKDRLYVIREMRPAPETGNIGVEIHDAKALGDLRSFIISLFIRCEVYASKTLGKSLLGPRFSFYAKAHADGMFDGQNAGLVLMLNSVLGESHSSPVKTRFGNRNCVMMFFCGYSVCLISDGRGPEVGDLSNLVTDREIVIPVSGGTDLPHIDKIVNAIRKIGPINRKRQK